MTTCDVNVSPFDQLEDTCGGYLNGNLVTGNSQGQAKGCKTNLNQGEGGQCPWGTRILLIGASFDGGK